MITRLPVTITLRAPFATRDNAAGSFGIDLPLARDSAGRLMLAGTHILGKLVEATRELSELLPGPEGDGFRADLRDLHAEGSQGNDAQSTGREARRNLGASDFLLQDTEDTEDIAGSRTRIARDNVTGVVAEGMLQVIEQPFAVGKQVAFKGELRLFGTVDAARQARLLKALEFVTQMGGLRTIGYGEIAKVAFHDAITARPPAQVAAGAPRLALRLRFADPFCAGEARNTSNTYVSAGYVPGGVIKGAIARQLLASAGLPGGVLDATCKMLLPEMFHPLIDGFAELVIRHAVPVPPGATLRPRTVPDSLAALDVTGGVRIVDLAGLDRPQEAGLIDGVIPTARPDWKGKHFDACDAIFGAAQLPGRQLRIRTQIDRTLRASKVNRLFGIEYTEVTQHDFLSQIELPAGSPPGLGIALAHVLKDGLSGIGRGGAFAEVTLTDADVPSPPRPAPHDNRAILTLASLALLRRPVGGRDLRACYAAAFAEIGLPDGWTLSAVFARERLAGGGFFLSRRGGGDYRPWLLTEPGATFVFDRTNGTSSLPDSWFDHGLPIPCSVQDFYGLTDQVAPYLLCPYLPQNGYGEVTMPAQTLQGEMAHQALRPMSWEPIALCAEVLA